MGLKGLPIKCASEPQPAFCPNLVYVERARRRLAIANFVSTGTPPAVD